MKRTERLRAYYYSMDERELTRIAQVDVVVRGVVASVRSGGKDMKAK